MWHARAQGYERDEEALGLRQRLAGFARENAKFADVKRALKDEVAQRQARAPVFPATHMWQLSSARLQTSMTAGQGSQNSLGGSACTGWHESV